MATFNLKRFSKPDTLKSIRADRLLEFLAPYGRFFGDRGVPLPPKGRESEFEYERLAKALMTPDSDTPPDLANALYFVDQMATASAMDDLLEECERQGLRVDGGGDVTPADVAVQVWVLDARLLERTHATQYLIRPRSFDYYRAKVRPVPKFKAPSQAAVTALERELDDWFEKKRRGRGARVFLFPEADVVWFLVRHGQPFERRGVVKDGESTSLFFRGEVHDVLGGLSKEEATRFDALVTEAEAFDAEATENRTRADRMRQNGDALASYAQPRPRQAADPAGEPLVAREAWRDDPQCGFKSPREFLLTVLEAPQARRLDKRLQFLSAAGSDEHGEYSDPHGNFLLPVGFSPTLMTTPTEADPVAGRTTALPMSSPVVEWPARVDKDHTTSVSGGLTVTRKAETVAAASSRMKFEKIRLSVDDLFGVAIATERILTDSPISFAALLDAGFNDEFAARILWERLYGSGIGEYMGVLNSPCLVSVARTTGGSIKGADILTARRRCWRYSEAIWLANHDTYEDLAKAHITGTNGDVFLFNPARGEDVPDMLLGRPVFFTEFAETKGTKGDLLLGAWSQYLEGTYQTTERAESIHVRFLEHERVFKFWLRNAGAPWWNAALTPKKGAATLSPFVTIAT